MVNNETEREIGGSEDSGERDKSELVKQTEAANAAVERMVKAKEEIDAAEAKRALGGVIDAGKETKKEEKVVDPIQYSKDALAGKFNR